MELLEKSLNEVDVVWVNRMRFSLDRGFAGVIHGSRILVSCCRLLDNVVNECLRNCHPSSQVIHGQGSAELGFLLEAPQNANRRFSAEPRLPKPHWRAAEGRRHPTARRVERSTKGFLPA